MGIFWRRKQQELSEELEGHVHMAARERVDKGECAELAHEAARQEFGNESLIRESTADQWGWRWLETFLQDFQYGVRGLRKSPGFTLVVVLTLALGIGANTAIFSVVYAVLLKPLPYPNPDRLAVVFEAMPQEGVAVTGISYVNFAECREQNTVFSEMAGYQAHDLTLTGAGEPSVVHTIVVTPEVFSLLNVRPFAGRTFFSEDGKRGAAPVVIVSENLWRGRFGADPQLVGRSITLDKRAFTVVGIMPRSFRFPVQAASEDVWIPLVQDPLFGPWMERAGGHWLTAIGRLKPGVSMARAQSEMEAMSARLAKENPAENAGWMIRIEPMQQVIVKDVRPALLVLLGAVGLVLLIACANIANLLLSRATSRSREIAVRIALGAGRQRIIRQLLTESAVLGSLGGTAGILLAYSGVSGLSSLLSVDLPQVQAIHVDTWVLGFALLLSAAATLIFGLAPALLAAGPDLQAGLKEGRSTDGNGHQGARNVLAIAEIALAMVLLVGAGLLIRSFSALTSVSPGFTTEHIMKADISLPQFQYSKPQQWSDFSRELLARIQSQPGMRESAAAVPLPIASGPVNLGFVVEGNPPLPPGISRNADYAAVSPGYFRVMGIPLLRGRFFNEQDSPSAVRVAVISEALAKQEFPNDNPLGRRLVFGFPPDGNAPREIVGIVADVHDVGLAQEPGPMMYVPFAQAPFWGEEVVVKSTLAPSSVVAAIRKATYDIDKDLPVTDIESLPAAIGDSVAQPRLHALLLALFGGIALALAAVGIFAVISYSVSRRTHEIGIRLALGAKPGDVLRLIFGELAKLVFLGLALGIAGALLLTRFLSTLLFEVRPTDPLTFAGIALLLALVALVACYIPGRRAMRVDPMVALRYE